MVMMFFIAVAVRAGLSAKHVGEITEKRAETVVFMIAVHVVMAAATLIETAGGLAVSESRSTSLRRHRE